ncbi:hypothetical protein J2Z83_003816 [Virgibacillus natechei]|uniref:DUF4305 domain-containing protein n=1 Tax=Virgibacillus natechei TaxID=1216297 RepID=A0ABS4INR7_9BACI|nr:YdiK family protein [Virgibacillus natechei]MBP1971664.1 hypothetical protein [Virgibacillus natechei]UZD13849.1 YdiK family protein [Virgibacillus natechei]
MTMAIIYFIMGILFVYVGIQFAEETIWNVTTIVLAAVATLDFGIGIRMMSMHLRSKKNKKK